MNKNNIIRNMALTLVAGMAIPCQANAQGVIKGTVTISSTHEKFAGARIIVIGTKNVAMSDENGAFELKDAAQNSVLQIEAPGCELQIVALQGRKDLAIQVVPVSSSKPFYTSETLSSLTSYHNEDMAKTALSASEDIDIHLNGAARNIRQSGIDAIGSNILVRGIHSANMTNTPLYVVDGVIWQSQDDQTSLHSGYFSNPLALISPDDIESIQILKNGTAIYGAKAANGVILINTKRSHNMATEITVNAWAGIKSAFKSIPMLDASDYRMYATDVMKGMDNINQLMGKYHFLNDDPSNSYYLSSHNNTNWNKEINSSAFTQNYSVGVRGGDDIALYSFSLGYTHNDGNIDKTNFNRLHVRFNSDIKFTKHFTTRADISFAQITRDLFDDGINEYSSPLYLSYIKSPLYHPHQYDISGKLYNKISDKDELGIGNPLAVTENAEGKTKNYRFTATLAPKYQFTDRFSLSAIAGYSWDKIKESAFIPDFGLAERQLFNEQGDWYGEGNNSVASLMTRNNTLTLGAQADWKVLQGNHDLLLEGGFTYINNTFESNYGMGYNTGSDNLRNLSVTNSSLRTILGEEDNWRTLRWNVMANYNYQNLYFLYAIATMENNSRFGKNADSGIRLGGISWAVFPSVTGAWVISNEKFMRSLPFVNYLKLYTGYEVTGNDDIPVNATHTYFENIGYAGLAKGLTLSNIGNDQLSWEKTGTWNIGIDMNLFSNRLNIGAEYFISTTNNLLVQKQLQEEYGLKYYWSNDGKLSNKGYNISMEARLIDNQNWKLNFGTSIGHYKNEVKSLGNGDIINSIYGGEVLTTVGQPLGVFYGYKTKGVFATSEEAQQAHLNVVSETGAITPFGAGDIHFDDRNKDGYIDEGDRQIIGDPNPDIYGNFHFNVAYRRFSLGATFTYSLGNDAYNALRANLESGSSLNNQTKNMNNRWVADGQITTVPKATYGDPMGNARFSDRWIEDASYLKLRQITASYTLPIKAKFIQGASVWVAVNNVFTLTKYLGSDPEFGYGNSLLYQGIDAGLTPSTRSYNIGIKLNL